MNKSKYEVLVILKGMKNQSTRSVYASSVEDAKFQILRNFPGCNIISIRKI